MKIAAVVVIYHPDSKLLYNNIAAFADYVDKVIVWKNSGDKIDNLAEWGDKILFMGDGNNHYIAKPLNEAMKYCLSHGYDYLLTMDQDSCWTNFKGFVETISKSMDDGNIGIFAPNVNCYLKDYSVEYKDIEWVIQSGMLINLKVVSNLGGFREDYGMYGVDEEFCYWLNSNGKKVRCFTNFSLKQRYGDAKKSRFGFTVYNYSPIVRYHLIRNMIWMKREFPQSTITRRILHVIFDNYRDIILAEDDKFNKAIMFSKGILHGAFRKIPTKRELR